MFLQLFSLEEFSFRSGTQIFISRLNAYIVDYLKRRKFNQAASELEREAKLPAGVPIVETPQGFLYEWWAVFWDVFNARISKQSTVSARKYVEVRWDKQEEFEDRRIHNSFF
jgi:hypothetical protein